MPLTEKQKLARKQRAIQQRWVKALLSGNYKQGKRALRIKGNSGNTDRFCCLGVLCELAVKAKVISKPTLHQPSDVYKYGGRSSLLPTKVVKWAGLKNDNGRYFASKSTDLSTDLSTNLSTNLAVDNDNGKTFKTIAKIIEQRPEGLFVN